MLNDSFSTSPSRTSGCFTSELDYQRSFYSGNLPPFIRGVGLEVVKDDGSPAFTQLHERVKEGGAGGVWE